MTKVMSDSPESSWGVLDLGCGPCGYSDFIPEGVLYVGLEIDARVRRSAERRLGGRTGLDWVVMSPDAWEAEACAWINRCDRWIVLGLGVVHHVDDDVFHAMLSTLPSTYDWFSYDPTIDDSVPRFARYLASRDRGEYVRTPTEYTELLSRGGIVLSSSRVARLMNIPTRFFEASGRRSTPVA